MTYYCTACSQRLGSADELCQHRNPVGYCCCDTEHGGGSGYDDEWGNAA